MVLSCHAIGQLVAEAPLGVALASTLFGSKHTHVGVCGVPKNAAQKLKSTVPCFRGRLFLACLLFQFGAHFLSTEIGVLIFLDL